MGLFAFRCCVGHYVFVLACASLSSRCCVRHFFFVLACASFCVPSLRRSLFLCAGMGVFEHSASASVIFSFCRRVGLFAFRRGVRNLFFVLVCGSLCVPSLRRSLFLCNKCHERNVIPMISRITLRIQYNGQTNDINGPLVRPGGMRAAIK